MREDRCRPAGLSATRWTRTIVVAIEDRVRHPLYKKIVKHSMKLKAHDERMSARSVTACV